MTHVLVKKNFLLAFMLLMMGVGKAQEIVSPFEGIKTNGDVNAIAVDEANDIIYIGGDFTRLGGIPNGAAVDPATGDVPEGYPAPNGLVEAAVSDGNGGYYIGGYFSEVGGITRNHLAHIDQDGNVTSWNPNLNGNVFELELVGNTLYVGGQFTSILGESRYRIAAVDVTTGNLLSWAPTTTFIAVYAIEEYNGLIYVGGQGPLMAIDATDATIDWSVTCSIVYDLEIENDLMYVGGTFGTINGTARSRLGAIDLTDNSITAWDPSPDRDVNAIAPNGSSVFIVGDFLNIGGEAKRRVAELDASTGDFTSFAPFGSSPSFNPDDLVLDGSTLYIGGRDLYVVDITTGDVISGDIIDGLNINSIRAIAIGTDDVYAGGGFSSIGGTKRERIAAINATTGELTSFDPGADDYVRDLILDGTTLYISGAFNTIDGTTRNAMASINTTNNTLTNWDPDVQYLSLGTGSVNKMLIDGSLMYIAGFFTQVGEDTRYLAAAIDITTGDANEWNPTTDLGFINDIAIDGDVLYAGGSFTSFGGQARRRIAAVDKNTGVLSDWNPTAGGSSTSFVNAIEVAEDGTVYVGGQFTTMGGIARNRLAAIDPTTGDVTDWDPGANSHVYSLHLTESGILYAGGSFSLIGTDARNRLASFNISDGLLEDWAPDPAGTVNAIVTNEFNTYIGGTFAGVLDSENTGFAVVSRSPGPPVSLSLDNLNVDEAQEIGTIVGTLSVVDEPDTHTYELVSGDGDEDNADFDIDGDQLITKVELDYETATSKNIRVRVTDGQGNMLEEMFTINVENVIETGNDILTFSIPGQLEEPVFDINPDIWNRIYVKMPFETDFTNVQINFTLSSGATTIAESGSTRSFNLVPNGGYYYGTMAVTAEDGSTKNWQMYLLTPLSGIYSVKAGGDFEDFKHAVHTVREGGITGDVVLELEGDHTASSIILDEYEGMDMHHLTIRPTATADEVNISGNFQALSFRGAENITIDGQNKITFEHLGDGDIIQLYNDYSSDEPTENIIIENCTFVAQATAIQVSSSMNCTIRNNQFITAPNTDEFAQLVDINGLNPVSIIEDVTIESNFFSINSDFNFPTGTIYGISVDEHNGNTIVSNNVLEISPAAAATIYGIEVTRGDDVTIAHNTIVFKGTNQASSSALWGIRGPNLNQGPTSSFVMTNNLIDLGSTITAGTHRGFYIRKDDTPLIDISNNNISLSGSGGDQYYAQVNLTDHDDDNFEDLLVEAPSTTKASISFFNAPASSYQLSGESLNEKDLRGVPVTGIANDFNGDPRSTNAPSKGAFETANNIAEILNVEMDGIVLGPFVYEDFRAGAYLEAGTDISSLAPEFELFPGATISPLSGSTQDFSGGPVIYTVTAEADNTQDWEVTLVEANVAPEDISLASNTLSENAGVNAVVGQLSTVDDNFDDSHTYTLVGGVGDEDNGLFDIDGDNLVARNSISHEDGDGTYSVRVRSTDEAGLTTEKIFEITILDINEAPTGLSLDNQSIQEATAVGTVVGTLTTEDEDQGETFIYSLVSGEGDEDNEYFEIDDNQLVSDEVFDFESRELYSVRIQTFDGEFSTSTAFEITITDVGPTITDIGLTVDNVDENSAVGTVIGTLSTLGEEITGTYTYSFVEGMNDNDLLDIVNTNELVVNGALNHEEQSVLVAEIMTSDGEGGTFSKQITIDINDVNEAPTLVDLDENEFEETETLQALTSFYVEDPDEGDTFEIDLVSGDGDDDNDKFTIVQGQGSLIGIENKEPLDFEMQESYSIRVRVTDAAGLTLEDAVVFLVIDVNEAPSFIDQVFEVNENTSNGTLVGQIVANDPEEGTLTFSDLTGEIGAVFQISSDGQLTVEDETFLNFENTEFFEFEAEVTDGEFIETANIRVNILDINEAPTFIELSNSSIDESNPIGTVVGVFSTTDEDMGQSYTYSLVPGAADAHNASFTIEGNQLLSAEVFDYETQGLYSIRVRTDDGNGGTFESGFGLSINDLPAQITSIELNNNAINENEDAGTAVGTFATFGEDLSGSFTYDLVAGTGSDDNASFIISNDQLLTTQSFDFETKNSYSIRVMVDDGSLTFEEIITISVNDISEAPTDISLNPTSITENNEVGDVIGTFTTTDEDAGETYTYLLVSGDGDTDNASFTIANDELRAGVILDFEAQSSYAVRVETNDGNGGTFQKAFTITLENENESISVANPLADQTVTEGFGSLDIDLSSVFVDTDGDPLTFGVSSANTSVVTVSETDGTLTLTEAGVGTTIVTVTADDGSGSTTSDEFEITVEAAPLGLAEDLNIKVYPNPTTDFISIDAGDLLNVKLYDLNGRMMQAKKGQNITLDVRSIPSGVYVLRVSDGTRSVNHRIIKTN